MSDFKELLEKIHPNYPEQMNLNRLLGNDGAQNEIDGFFDKYGFKNLSFLAAGEGALVFFDTENPNLVFRLATDAGFCERKVIPYVLQPLFAKNNFEEISDFKLEILPRLATGNDDEWKNKLIPEFEQELSNSNTRLPKDASWDDFGIFEYPDPINRGKTKRVLMAADDSVFMGTEPRCTADYPSLAIQQA